VVTTIAPPAVLAPAERAPALTVQFVRFAAVGVVTTGLFVGLYLVFRTVASATLANLIATVLTTVSGTRINGRVTFDVRGPIRLRHHVKSLLVTGLGLAITTYAVTLVTGEFAEVVVLVLASGVAGAVRFVLMRQWVYH
jgi:putative flippase GtrA